VSATPSGLPIVDVSINVEDTVRYYTRTVSSARAAIAVGLLMCIGCASHLAKVVKEDFEGPGYRGGPEEGRGSLRVVTFNIKFAKSIAGAIHLFATRTELRNADIVMLQEMDHRGDSGAHQ
jgi:hypothetical protein